MKPFRSWPISDCYKIPAIGDIPKDFRVAFLTDAEQPGNIYGSKAVGEPPLMVICCLLFVIRLSRRCLQSSLGAHRSAEKVCFGWGGGTERGQSAGNADLA